MVIRKKIKSLTYKFSFKDIAASGRYFLLTKIVQEIDNFCIS